MSNGISVDFEELVFENSELTRQLSFAGKKANDHESKTQDMVFFPMMRVP